jgi:uncharacterized protein YigA (DUF484 family)
MNSPITKQINPIDEETIARYLKQNPEFFERQKYLLATIRLSNTLGKGVISLQEKQVGVLQERIQKLEYRITEFVQAEKENELIVQKILLWVEHVFSTNDYYLRIQKIPQKLAEIFDIPQVVLKLWDYEGNNTNTAKWINHLQTPYCGVIIRNTIIDRWLKTPEQLASLAVIPLRYMEEKCFGTLLCASHSKDRFTSDMSVGFLKQVGILAGTALRR